MSLSPPRWTPAELAFSVERAVRIFRDQRLSEARDDYASHFEEARSAVEDLLELTTDLATLRQMGGRAIIDGGYLEAVRYLAAPPVSTDDLETLSGVTESQFAKANQWLIVVDTIMTYIDSQRFPWIVDNQEPTEAERHAAVIATAAQIAARRILTARANEAKRNQEDLVKQALRGTGFEEVRAREVRSSGSFPRSGQYCGESKVGHKKADIVAGLRDERILAIECKVSNSKVNSTKRIGSIRQS
ncbi:MAG: XamI family restriction endonuclease [Streptosporangiaceae bacterium]